MNYLCLLNAIVCKLFALVTSLVPRPFLRTREEFELGGGERPGKGSGKSSRPRGGWTRPRDVRNNCIPEHGALENVWGKRFFLVLSFTRAPQTEFGETLGRCSR